MIVPLGSLASPLLQMYWNNCQQTKQLDCIQKYGPAKRRKVVDEAPKRGATKPSLTPQNSVVALEERVVSGCEALGLR